MKVFLSWSGDTSRAVAELLREWLKSVIQALQPWMSDDMEPGTVWFPVISENMNASTVGIICLTRENMDRPWILFEAGSLARGLSTQRVCALLIDLQPSDLRSPLSQFNGTSLDRDGITKLIQMLNRGLGADKQLSAAELHGSLNRCWPEFERRLEEIKKRQPTSVIKPRTVEDMVEEVLLNTREIKSAVQNLELPSNFDIRQISKRLAVVPSAGYRRKLDRPATLADLAAITPHAAKRREPPKQEDD